MNSTQSSAGMAICAALLTKRLLQDKEKCPTAFAKNKDDGK
jgi:hypothetical protein